MRQSGKDFFRDVVFVRQNQMLVIDADKSEFDAGAVVDCPCVSAFADFFQKFLPAFFKKRWVWATPTKTGVSFLRFSLRLLPQRKAADDAETQYSEK